AAGGVHRCNPGSGRCVEVIHAGEPLHRAALTRDGSAALATERGSVLFCPAPSGPCRTLAGPDAGAHRIAVDAAGRSVAWITKDGRLEHWVVATGAAWSAPVGAKVLVRQLSNSVDLAFSADGSLLLATLED